MSFLVIAKEVKQSRKDPYETATLPATLGSRLWLAVTFSDRHPRLVASARNNIFSTLGKMQRAFETTNLNRAVEQRRDARFSY